MKRLVVNKQIALGALAVLLVCMAAGLWFLAETRLYEGVRLAEGFSQLRLSDEPVGPPVVRSMIESAGDNYDSERRPSFTGWTQKGAVQVENPDLSRKTELNVVFYYGESGYFMDGFGEKGCILSRETAYRLFGTIQVPAGAEILVDGEPYHVEKVSGLNSPDVAVKLSATDTQELDVLNVYSRGLSRLEFSTATVVTANGLKSRTSLEYDGLFATSRMLRNLPFWCLILGLAGVCIRGSWRGFREKVPGASVGEATVGSSEEKPWRRSLAEWAADGPRQDAVAKAGFAVLLVAAGMFLLGAPLGLPQRFIPTVWSDFSFWSATFNDLSEQVNLVMSMELYQPDIYYRTLLLEIIGFGWLAALCLGMALICARPLLRERREPDGICDTEEHQEGI